MLLLTSLAFAADLQIEAKLSWSELGHFPGGEDALPVGVEHLVAGPDGELALYDAVLREVVLVEDGEVALSFPVRLAGDLVFTPSGELATIDTAARQVALWSRDGAELARVRLPDLVPTHATLAVDGGELVGVDLFGNQHAIARLGDHELEPSLAPALQEIASDVTWDPESRTMITAGLSLELPDAVKASGQRFGDWLVVDTVTSDQGPIAVGRAAWHVPTGQRVELPLERLYAPRGEYALRGDDLLVLLPATDGPQIWRVSP